MKKISKQQAELIVAASNEGLTHFPPAALEKDILLTEILHVLKTNNYYESQLLQTVFGGGTSLIKGFSIISRMSEDLDFKIIGQSRNPEEITRPELGRLRDSIQNALEQNGYLIKDTNTRDSRRYFKFILEYESAFEPIVSLRSNIQLEFTCSKVSLDPQLRKIATLLYRDSKLDDPFDFEFLCVHPTQTAAEKLVGLLRKFDEIQSGENDRLIRHVYDLHKLKQFGIDKENFTNAVLRAVDEDDARYKSSYPEDLKKDPVTFLNNSLVALLLIPNLNRIYESFVTELISGEQITLEAAKMSLKELVENL